MEFRKIIGFGGNSYVVCMPKSWIQKNMLKKGDLVSVKENRDEITFSSNDETQKKEPKSIIIEADNKSIDFLRTEIIAAYLNNYDSIEIVSKELQKNASVIKDIIRNLAGFEIMMQTSQKIAAKDLLNINEISIKTIIKRMDFITRAMIDDSIECLKGKELYEDINQRDVEVNRLHFLACRVIRNALKDQGIMRNFDTNPLELHIGRQIATRIENAADRQKTIARYLWAATISAKQKEGLAKIYKIMRESYLDVMKAYYTNDKKSAFKVEVANESRIKMCDKFLKEHTKCFLNIDKKQMPQLEETGGRRYCNQLGEIVENLKAMDSSIKYIARAVIGMD